MDGSATGNRPHRLGAFPFGGVKLPGSASAGEQDFAFHRQRRSSEVLQTDRHPAARVGENRF